MKKKLKKLALSRETLVGLVSSSLQNAGGGQDNSRISWCATCESCTGRCCPP